MEIECKVLAGDCIVRTAKIVCDKNSTVESLIESYINKIIKQESVNYD